MGVHREVEAGGAGFQDEEEKGWAEDAVVREYGFEGGGDVVKVRLLVEGKGRSASEREGGELSSGG